MTISLGEKEKRICVHAFRQDGTPIYSDKLNGYFMRDVAPKFCDRDYKCWTRQSNDESDYNDKHKKRSPCKPSIQILLNLNLWSQIWIQNFTNYD